VTIRKEKLYTINLSLKIFNDVEMNNDIQIIEKPDWVSWDDIHELLWNAHAENRKNGVFMRYPTLSGEEIRQRVEGIGKMFCAFVDGKMVGTGAIVAKSFKLWFTKESEVFGYQCFAAVLPEFTGKGIYKLLNLYREQESRRMGINRLMFDTHEGNIHILNILKKNGYKFVDYKFYKNHYNIVMVKWLDGCPYGGFRLWYEFTKRKLKEMKKRGFK